MTKKELKKNRKKVASKLLSIQNKKEITFSDLVEYAKLEKFLRSVSECLLSI